MEETMKAQEAAGENVAPAVENANPEKEVETGSISGDLKGLTDEMRQSISAKIAEIKKEKKLKRVYAIVVFGDDEDEKDVYVGYFRRPDFPTYTMFSMKAANDPIQASRMLAQNCFVAGDKELVDDDDLFSFGLAAHITALIEGRDSELVKGSSVGK